MYVIGCTLITTTKVPADGKKTSWLFLCRR